MALPLFQPDNFSQTVIKYKKLDDISDILRDVLRLYFNNFEIREIWQLDRAEVNSQNFKIILSANGKTKKFLLRKYQNLSDIGQITFYLNLLRFLSAHNVQVSKIMNALDGSPVVATDGGIYALFDFIAADYFSPSEKSFGAVAQEIAAMHKALRNFDQKQIAAVDAFSKKAAVYYNKVKSYSENDFLEIENILAGKDKNDNDDIVLAKLPFIKSTIAEVAAAKQEIAVLPKQIIHSDLHPHNILMVGEKVRALIDFDAMRLSERARDTAFAIYRFGRQLLLNSDENKAAAEAPRLVNMFLGNYNEADALSDLEVGLMPILIKDEFLIKILFVLNGIYKERNFPWIKDLSKFMAAFEEINYFWPKRNG